MKRIVMAALTLPIFLVGCGAEAPAGEVDTGSTSPDSSLGDYQNLDTDDSNAEVFSVMVDGVKCRVAVVYLSVAMDCEEPKMEVTDGLG